MISIIIVAYNVPDLLLRCVESVKKSVQSEGYEIIIVDNASRDNARDKVLSRFPDVTWIQNEQNLGFASAVNIGLSKAGRDYFLLLNPDSEIQPDALSALQSFWKEHPDAGIVGGRILNPDGTFQKQCRRYFPKPSSAFFRLFRLSFLFPRHKLTRSYELDLSGIGKTHEIDAVAGAFMSFSRDLVDDIGMFDEGYFLMGEDLDFCYRTKLAAKKVFYFPDAIITHFHGASRRTRPFKSTFYGHVAMTRYFRKFLRIHYTRFSTGLIYLGILCHFLAFSLVNCFLFIRWPCRNEKN